MYGTFMSFTYQYCMQNFSLATCSQVVELKYSAMCHNSNNKDLHVACKVSTVWTILKMFILTSESQWVDENNKPGG